jgi:2-amino-4-deoxychorismate synthase
MSEQPTVRVETLPRPVPRIGALPAYLALAERFGRDQVYLLESAGGPPRDSRYEFAGFGVLLTVSVTGGEVRVEGVPALREAVLARIAPLLDAELRLPAARDLWPVLRAVRSTFDAKGSSSRYRFGFLSYFGYDANRYIEDLPYLIERTAELPDVQLMLYQGCLITDRTGGDSELLLHESAAWPGLNSDEIAELLADAEREPPAIPDAPPEALVEDDTEYDEYLDKVTKSLGYIGIGDIYQVQIGHELTIRSAIDPLDVYLRLRDRNASPYMYLTTIAGHTVIGASPEMFARVEDGTVTMRPIAGTMPRGAADDEVAARRLRRDPKELAEHTMLVDLCRNDLGRICRPDTLAVPDHFVIERYSHVLHMVSTVTAEMEDGTDGFDIVAALFPAGTMTGTPKIRSMEIIEELEHSRRGLYAGALGLIDVGGYINMALCIRTLIHHAGRYRTRASAGVVADSVADREWTETLAKLGAAYWAVTGRELR